MKVIDDFFDTKIEILGRQLRLFDLFFISVMTGLGIVVRLALFSIESGDYYQFLSHWMEECHNAGGIGYLGIEPGSSDASTINYGCMYQYVIVLLHYLGGAVEDMYLVKAVSVIFDFVCAAVILRIALEVTGDIKKAGLCYGIMMFLPTVVLNSAAWAQCDSIYCAFLLLSFLHFMKRNNGRVFIYFAIAYTFKQQAIFILPFYLIMWLKGKLRIRYVFWVPVVVFLTMIPAMLAGRNFSELLSVYGKQVATYSILTMNYPNIYSVVSTNLKLNVRKALITSGTVASVAALGAVAYYVRDKKFRITREYLLTLLIFTIELCLFTMPVMHERYGYFPEVLAVVYGMTGFKRMGAAVLLQVISIITYSRFLFGSTVTALWPVSLMMLAVLIFTGYDLYVQMKASEVKNV